VIKPTAAALLKINTKREAAPLIVVKGLSINIGLAALSDFNRNTFQIGQAALSDLYKNTFEIGQATLSENIFQIGEAALLTNAIDISQAAVSENRSGSYLRTSP